MNKHNESRPFLDKLESDIASGLPATKAYQMVLEYLDERDRERNELSAQVERFLRYGRKATYHDWLNPDYINVVDGAAERMDEIESVFRETPAQSLEAVKREWKEEFVELARRNAEYGLGDSLAIDIEELKAL